MFRTIRKGVVYLKLLIINMTQRVHRRIVVATRIPVAVINEFMKNPRLVTDGGTNGTRPVDLKLFKLAITETLQKKEVIQQLVNAALKQGEFRVG
jgi:hypothetical protein